MFRDEKDEFNTNDYDILQILGYGAFGRVYKAKCRRLMGFSKIFPIFRALKSGRVVALKRIDLKTRARTTPLAVLREISTLRNVEHENIIALMDVSFANTSLILVMEYVRTNLSAAIKDATRPRTFGVVKFFFKQIFAALAYLHANDIMHRDLKPENILLNAQNRVKLADFGQARLHLPNRTYEHEVGTRWYRAPELLFGATVYTPNVDIWSAGCVLAEFLNEKPLFSGSTDLEQLSQIFAVLGTPNKDNWPEWSQLPDATKITFKPRHPTPKLTDLIFVDAFFFARKIDRLPSKWETILEMDGISASTQNDIGGAECMRLLCVTLRLDPATRWRASDCLNAPFFASGIPQDLVNYRVPLPSYQQNLQHFQQQRQQRARRQSAFDKSLDSTLL